MPTNNNRLPENAPFRTEPEFALVFDGRGRRSDKETPTDRLRRTVEASLGINNLSSSHAFDARFAIHPQRPLWF